jgi:hypothetical protein
MNVTVELKRGLDFPKCLIKEERDAYFEIFTKEFRKRISFGIHDVLEIKEII